MRTRILVVLAGSVLTMAAMPAQAAWKSYISKELGFAFQAPGEVKSELGTYRGADAGPRQTMVFRSVEDNIEYKVSVMSFQQAGADGATIVGEREYMFQDKKKVLSDTFARAETGKDAVYGRKITVDQPGNKGRTSGAFYFTKGRLITLEATVLPAHGGLDSPDAARFLDSVVFQLARADKAAVELKVPELE